ncbi:MAG TPA: DegV family protein [Anaerolineae bacterium]|nr:DegV family protein [Anaerolineae bacterium]
MTRTAILTDSSAYLPSHLIEKHSIRVIPLTILWGTEAILDAVEITPNQFLDRLAIDPIHPTTTQPNPEDFQAVYEELAANHDAIVAPLISSKLSGTVNSAKAALETFSAVPVRVIDTQTTSMGLGFAVLAAAKAVAQGAALDEIEEAARTVADDTRIIFVVDTLDYLHKGGRIGGAKRLMGSMLSIKPVLHINEGAVDSLESVRTKTKAVDRMLELIAEHADGCPARAAVIHAGSADEAEEIRKRIDDLISCQELLITDISPAISVHTGPGTIGVAICPA